MQTDEERTEKARTWRNNNKKKIKIYKQKEKEKYANDEQYRTTVIKKRKLRHLKLKSEVLAYYSTDNTPTCVICGFNDIRALSIDHIDNNGACHRRALGDKTLAGHRFYLWLKKQNLPKGYQCLCMNCQWEKR